MESRELGMRKKRGCNSKASKFWIGLLILTSGAVLLLRQMGFLLDPAYQWLFTWPMILVVVGIFSGFATRFRDLSWLILIGIGFLFLIDDIVPGFSVRQYMWPLIIIGVGLLIIFAPRRKSRPSWRKDQRKDFAGEDHKSAADELTNTEATESSAPIVEVTQQIDAEEDIAYEETLDVTAIFGGIKKIVVSKAFKGGSVVSIFGGSEINLSQADFKKQIAIEAVQVFGGCTLIIPPNWQVRAESVTIFGGIDDKRERISDNPDKVLTINGFTMFGGIEIKSY